MPKKQGKDEDKSQRTLKIIIAIILIVIIACVVVSSLRGMTRAQEQEAQEQAASCQNDEATPKESGAPLEGEARTKAADESTPAPGDNTPLLLGNPSGAEENEEARDNFLMRKANYVLSYNAGTLTANWVAWHLDAADLGDALRSNTFRVDDALPAAFYHVKSSDYQFNKYGFDRGHLCPSADRTVTDEANSETFLMTNMVPQSPDNNRVVWKTLEEYERDTAARGNELYIFAGTQGTGGESKKGEFDSIVLKGGKSLSIAVPAYTWKIMLILPAGDGDLARIGKDTEVIAVRIPNRQGLSKWQDYTASVDTIEENTKLDFFAVLDDEIEDFLEAAVR